MDRALWGAAIPKAIPGVMGKGKGQGRCSRCGAVGSALKETPQALGCPGAGGHSRVWGEGKSKHSKAVRKNPTGNPPAAACAPPNSLAPSTAAPSPCARA